MIIFANFRAVSVCWMKVVRGKWRRLQLDRVLANIRKRHPLPATEAERVRLADHSDLYGPDGLPR